MVNCQTIIQYLIEDALTFLGRQSFQPWMCREAKKNLHNFIVLWPFELNLSQYLHVSINVFHHWLAWTWKSKVYQLPVELKRFASSCNKSDWRKSPTVTRNFIVLGLKIVVIINRVGKWYCRGASLSWKSDVCLRGGLCLTEKKKFDWPLKFIWSFILIFYFC